MEKNLENTMVTAYGMIYHNIVIRKSLYNESTSGEDDPENGDNPTDSNIQKYIKKVSGDYVIDEILNDGNDDNKDSIKRGYITIFAENYEQMDNPFARLEAFRVEIYMPVRGFEEYQYRLSRITNQLFKMFQQKEIDGSFGRLLIERSFQINPPMRGYVGMAVIFSSGGLLSGC